MKFNDLTSEVARRLPGSVGAAQVNQIAKVLLDILCFFPDDEILSFMNRRKKNHEKGKILQSKIVR